MPIPSYAEIMELLKKGVTIEAQEKIMALREAVMTLQEENLNLRRELQELKAQSEVRDSVVFNNQNGIYEIKEGAQQGQYCQICYDKDKKLVRLQSYRLGSIGAENGYLHFCGVCQKKYRA